MSMIPTKIRSLSPALFLAGMPPRILSSMAISSSSKEPAWTFNVEDKQKFYSKQIIEEKNMPECSPWGLSGRPVWLCLVGTTFSSRVQQPHFCRFLFWPHLGYGPPKGGNSPLCQSSPELCSLFLLSTSALCKFPTQGGSRQGQVQESLGP